MQTWNLDQHEREAVKVFKALGDPTRYRIVSMLMEHRELGCGELAQEFGLSAPAMSHHYRVLENAGLITQRKEGSFVFLRLNEDQMERFLPGFVRAQRQRSRQPATAGGRRK